MHLPGGLQWAHPWAWLFAAVPVGLFFWRRRRRGQVLAGWADVAMQDWVLREPAGRRRTGRAWLAVLLWLLLAAALAGPRQPLRIEGAGAAQHRMQVMVLLELPPADTSGGLARQRMALHDLQARLHGERLGLMVFARGAGLLLPCTSDRALFNRYLDAASARLLDGRQGPGLAGALALAARELRREPGTSRAVLLLAGPGAAPPAARGGDGRAAALLRQQAAALRAARIPVFLAWSGPGEPGPQWSALVARSAGVQARLDRPHAWSRLYDRGLARLPADAPARGGATAWRELFTWPLLAALVVLLLLQARGPRPGRRAGGSASVALLLAAACAAWLVLPPPAAHADEALARWQAWQAWSRSQFPRCAELYARLAGFDARMGEGACAYRAGQFAAARRAFHGAMLAASDDRDRALALYDLGNAAFQVPGRLREALDAYRASLVLLPGRDATLRNLRLARARWQQEHPEYELVGMRKAGAPASGDRFGDTSDTTPSQMRHAGPKSPMVFANQALVAAGRLQASIARRQPFDAAAQPSAARLRADASAARRGMQLLHDHRQSLLRGLLALDSREASRLVGQP